MKTNVLIFAVLALSVFMQGSLAACNCAGCGTSAHIVGGSSWCRCCQTALIPSCDDVCRGNSVFTSDGCLAAGYGDTYCVPQDSPTEPPASTEPPTTGSRDGPTHSQTNTTCATEPPATSTEPPATSTEPPATSTEPPATSTEPPATSTEPPATSTDPPATVPTPGSRGGPVNNQTDPQQCNCVGCSGSWHTPGSSDWCRCCGVLYDNECIWNSLCDRSVFTRDGCDAANWNTLCHGSPAAHLKEDPAASTKPPELNDTVVSDKEEPGDRASAPTGVIVVLAILLTVAVLALISGFAYLYRDRLPCQRARTFNI